MAKNELAPFDLRGRTINSIFPPENLRIEDITFSKKLSPKKGFSIVIMANRLPDGRIEIVFKAPFVSDPVRESFRVIMPGLCQDQCFPPTLISRKEAEALRTENLHEVLVAKFGKLTIHNFRGVSMEDSKFHLAGRKVNRALIAFELTFAGIEYSRDIALTKAMNGGYALSYYIQPKPHSDTRAKKHARGPQGSGNVGDLEGKID